MPVEHVLSRTGVSRPRCCETQKPRLWVTRTRYATCASPPDL